MRRRLLFSTLAVAVSAVLLLGLPLAAVLGRLELNDARQQLDRDAVMIANGLQYRREAGKPADPKEIARSLPEMYLVIRPHGARALRFGKKPPAGDTISARAVTGDFNVTVETSGRVTGQTLTQMLILIGSLAALAIGVAVGLAVIQARRLTTPLVELAEAAERLGSGDSRRQGHRYGVAELDQVAEGLDRSARRVADMLAAEREFATDASHQLRTPLTALSMRLEEMIAAAEDPGAVREEGAAALAQIERLASVVSQLLGRTAPKQSGEATLTGIDDIVAEQAADWDPAFRHANRKIEITGTKGLRAVTSAGNLAQVIATLLDNALVHGAGTVTIRTWQTDKSVVVEVRDEGRGIPPELVPHIFERNVTGRPGGTGLGLALARAMAAADGGRVVLVRPRPAAFAVLLPRAPREDEGDAPIVRGPA
ncbi:MAG: ATP-binding protein [Micromonosporaceae bacterium]